MNGSFVIVSRCNTVHELDLRSVSYRDIGNVELGSLKNTRIYIYKNLTIYS